MSITVVLTLNKANVDDLVGCLDGCRGKLYEEIMDELACVMSRFGIEIEPNAALKKVYNQTMSVPSKLTVKEAPQNRRSNPISPNTSRPGRDY